MEWISICSGVRVEVEEKGASTWKYGDGGQKLKACERKERQDTEAIFIDSTSVALFFPLLCNTKPTQGCSNCKSTYVDIVHCCTAVAGWDLSCTELMTKSH